MQPVAFFFKCAEIEREVGDLYKRFSRRLGDVGEVAELFYSIALEEYKHSSFMNLLGRVEVGLKDDTEVKPLAVEAVEKMENSLRLANALLDPGKNLTAKEALECAFEIESTVFDAHSSSLLKTSNHDLIKTIALLAKDSARHRKLFAEQVSRLAG